MTLKTCRVVFKKDFGGVEFITQLSAEHIANFKQVNAVKKVVILKD